MGTNVHAILPLSECKSQKLKISDAEYTDHTAFLHVHSEFQFSFQISLRTFQKFLQQVCTIPFSDLRPASALRSHILFMFRTIPLWAARPAIFCVQHADLLPSFTKD